MISFMFTRKWSRPSCSLQSAGGQRLLCKQATQRQPVPVPPELPQSAQLPISLGTRILNSSPAISLMLGPSHPQRRTSYECYGAIHNRQETLCQEPALEGTASGWDFPGRVIITESVIRMEALHENSGRGLPVQSV